MSKTAAYQYQLRTPAQREAREGSPVAADLSGADCWRCRMNVICRRLLVAAAGLTLLLLYCVISPPILRQTGPARWESSDGRHRRDVVLVTDGRPGHPATACLRRLSPDLVIPAAPGAAQQIAFLVGTKNPCWLQELIQEDLDSLGNYSVLFFERASMRKLRERARLYQPFVRRPPAAPALRVRCLPYLFLIGQPKCGTTDLQHRIRLHPAVASDGLRGRGHWWSRERFRKAQDTQNPSTSFREYVDSYELAAHQLVGGECDRNGERDKDGEGDGDGQTWTPSSQMIAVDSSTSTMWDGAGHREARGSAGVAGAPYPPLGETVAAGLAALLPQARIIAILREPVDRLFSDYLYFDPGRDQDKSADEFHQRALQAVDGWTNCTAYRSEDDCSTDRDVTSSFRVRLHVGLYALYLRKWLAAFAREQVLILRSEDYKQNVTQVLQTVFTHLGLGSPSEAIWTKIRNSSPRNVRRKKQKQQMMMPETRQLLQDFYRPYNRRLAEMLHSDRFLWDGES